MDDTLTAGDHTRASRSREEFRALLALAAPVVTVQLGLMAMGVVDTLMVGRLSAIDLAGAALGNLYFYNSAVLAIGTLMALDPVVSQALGARDHGAVGRAVQRAMILMLALSVAVALLLAPAAPVLRAVRQQPSVIPLASEYVRISIAGVVPFLGFVVLRQSLQALHRVAPVVWAILFANAANVALNWVFIFGNLGAPRLGVAGSAIATAICRWLLALALLVLAWKDLRPHLLPFQRASLALVPLWRMLRLGLPIGLQQLLEVGAFGAVGLLMGTMGANEMAAHQIAIMLAAFTFMVPTGFAAAAAVRVGHAVGAGDRVRAKLAARAALICGVGFMAVTALVFLAFPKVLAHAFTDDVAVIAIAGLLIPIAGVFQVFDGGQAVGAGVLRGLGDTRAPLVAMLAGYWIIGVPVSAWLGFRTSLGAAGLWWGFVASLAAVAVFLFVRMRKLFRGELRPVVVDEERDLARFRVSVALPRERE